MSSEDPVLVDWPSEHVMRVQLNRPATHNAVNAELLAGLSQAIGLTGARAVLLCSSTPGRFCAGADLSLSNASRAEVSDGLYRLYRSMCRVAVPIVAAIGGPAVGAGAQLAVASDLRVAQRGAWLQFLGPGHGLAVGGWALPSLVGRGRALDLCLTGRRVDADEAEAMGLVDRVVDDAPAAALELARRLGTLDSDAVSRVKAVVARSWSRDDALELEAGGNRGWSGTVSPSPE